jgi:hypothetical protein
MDVGNGAEIIIRGFAVGSKGAKEATKVRK